MRDKLQAWKGIYKIRAPQALFLRLHSGNLEGEIGEILRVQRIILTWFQTLCFSLRVVVFHSCEDLEDSSYVISFPFELMPVNFIICSIL